MLELTVLGCATPYPSADNPCSGYLVRSRAARIWMDAGTGTLGPLQRYVRLDELDAIWISHLHADHSADLLTAYYGLLYADIELAAPIPLYGPPGIADRLANYLTNGPRRSPVESAFAVTELSDGHQVEVGDLTLTSAAVSHGLPAFAVRVAAGDESLTFSGDTAPCASLVALAKDTTVLLCEAENANQPADEEPVHHTPDAAGATAAAAGAGRLVVTHVGRSVSPDQAVDRASSTYGGAVDFATPGAVYVV
jgi:ribonuclease BN (tRNA processing enzyme)